MKCSGKLQITASNATKLNSNVSYYPIDDTNSGNWGKKYRRIINLFSDRIPIYLFHQSVLVIVAFFVLKLTNNLLLQFIMFMSLNFGLTILCYEIFRSNSLSCFMFGIKRKG